MDFGGLRLTIAPTSPDCLVGENTQVINELSWAKRGWCLLEKSVWEMKGPGLKRKGIFFGGEKTLSLVTNFSKQKWQHFWRLEGFTL